MSDEDLLRDMFETDPEFQTDNPKEDQNPADIAEEHFDDGTDQDVDKNKNDDAKSDLENNSELSFDPPASWGKDQHELFKKLPIEAQQQIVKREQASNKGISQLFERLEPKISIAENFEKVIEPYREQLKQLNDPTGINTIASFLEPARILNFGTQEEKANLLLSVAQQHGINFGNIANNAQNNNDPYKQEIQNLRQQINELTNLEKQRLIEHDKKLEQEVFSEFEAIRNDTENFPFFEQVAPQMHSLIKSGLADDLKDAYSKAIYLNSETQNKIIAEQAEKLKQSQTEKLNKAKSNSISPRTNSGVMSNETAMSDEDFDLMMVNKLKNIS